MFLGVLRVFLGVSRCSCFSVSFPGVPGYSCVPESRVPAFLKLLHADGTLVTICWFRMHRKKFERLPSNISRSPEQSTRYLIYFITLTCFFSGFVEIIHEHRKKNAKAEKETERGDPGHHGTSTNKPRPHTISLSWLVRRE